MIDAVRLRIFLVALAGHPVADGATFRTRLEALDNHLQAEHWTQSGPIFLRDGWKVT